MPLAQLTPLIDEFETSLQTGRIPQNYADWGRTLVSKLGNPIKIVVLGAPQSGKSAVIDMLLAIPALSQVPCTGMVEVHHGPQPAFEVELPGVGTMRGEGLVSSAHFDQTPLHIRQYLPSQRLSEISLTEITLAGPLSQQRALLSRATEYADMLLYCSQEFALQEQELWLDLTAPIKDHSLLVLTMADKLQMRGVLQDRLARLEPIATDQFLGLYPVAAINGLTAQTASEQPRINHALWRSSGGHRLYHDLMHRVEFGRTNDLDQLELLTRAFSPQSPQETAIPKPRNVSSVTNPTCAEQTLLDQASETISATARNLMNDIRAGADVDVSAILQGSLDCVRDLSMHLADADTPSPRMQAIQNATQDGEEVLLLCQLEQDEQAAIDAVTLLLQFKQEMSPSSAFMTETSETRT